LPVFSTGRASFFAFVEDAVSDERLLWLCYRAMVIRGLKAEAMMMLMESEGNQNINRLVEVYCKRYAL
jgi:hypothetical protein